MCPTPALLHKIGFGRLLLQFHCAIADPDSGRWARFSRHCLRSYDAEEFEGAAREMGDHPRIHRHYSQERAPKLISQFETFHLRLLVGIIYTPLTSPNGRPLCPFAPLSYFNYKGSFRKPRIPYPNRNFVLKLSEVEGARIRFIK